MRRVLLWYSSVLRFIYILAVCFTFLPCAAHAVDISDVPLESAIVTAPPIVIYVFDNSGSMDLEFMTDAFQGLFEGAYYLFPDKAYSPAPDHRFGAGHALGAIQRRQWRSQWAGYNLLYYSPRQSYRPWPATSTYSFGEADLHHPASDPTRNAGTGASLAMASRFFSVQSGQTEINVLNAHYFTYYDADGNGRWNNGENIYLVTWADDDQDGLVDLAENLGSDRRLYFRFADDGDGLVEDDELLPVNDEAEKNLIRPVSQLHEYLSDREELQNFVNWFSYYRRRAFAAKAVTAYSIANSGRMYAGLYAVNAGPRMGARLMGGSTSRSAASAVVGPAGDLIDALYATENKGSTPLSYALDQVGRYLRLDQPSALGTSPFLLSGGNGCQLACAVVVSDGFCNGDFSGVGNADGEQGKPYADAWSDTLADVAMAYYQADLAPDLPDMLPPTRCDTAEHQHMNTYALSPGLGENATGNSGVALDQRSTVCLNGDPSITANWLQLTDNLGVEGGGTVWQDSGHPEGFSGFAAFQGLQHAALNGRGRFFDASTSWNITQALPANLAMANESTSTADPVIDGMALAADSKVYQVSYQTGNWSGEVIARSLSIGTGHNEPVLGPPLWRASEMLPGDDDGIGDHRRIVTYGGRWGEPQGIPFQLNQMADGQRAALGSDLIPDSIADRRAKDLVDYIRGVPSPNGRIRSTALGDIVHSTPVLFGGTLFVGANDGMLHAFDVASGAERFAYTPNLVSDHLSSLADADYAEGHRYYVDGPLYGGEVITGEYQRKAYLVGGLGKGGKGYFCLLTGYRERSHVNEGFSDYQWKLHVDDLSAGDSENRVAELVRWEYPRPDVSHDAMDNDGDGLVDEVGESDPNIGYSFGAAYAVNANCPEGSYRPVVIFGNGYNSDSHKALLYVLDADTGVIVRVIDTGADGDNGLSTPALVDANLDRRVDYAYAGDLNGNLWKFDLTADHPDQWGVAYGADNNGDGVIDAGTGDRPEPLFQTQGQPITGRPDVMFMQGSCTAPAPGYMVYFGTGRYLGAADRSDTSQQSLYALWDYGEDSDDSEFLGKLTDRSTGLLSSKLFLVPKRIVEETTSAGALTRRLGGDEIGYSMVDDEEDGDGVAANNDSAQKLQNPDRHVGWFFDFPAPGGPSSTSAERIVGDVAVRDGKIVVSSYIPDNRPCGSGGNSWLYILTACAGDSPEVPLSEPLVSRRYPGKISNRPVIAKDLSATRQDLILFSDQFGQIQTLEMAGENWGKVYWWQSR
jgi:type IV pilus assembly protein PilY1